VQQHLVQADPLPRPLEPRHHREPGDDDGQQDHPDVADQRVRDGHDDACRERELAAEVAIERREGRHDLQHDDADEHQHHRDQNRRVDEGRQGLAADVGDDLVVGHVAPEHRLQVAAALARHEGCGIDGRKQRPVPGERVREGRSGLDLVVDAVEDALEGGVRDALAQDVQGLDEGHAGLEQCGQFLIEHEELAVSYFATAGPDPRQRRQPGAPPAKGQHKQPFFVEFPPQACLAVGDVHTFDDFAAGCTEPTAKFHGDSVAQKSARLPTRAGLFSLVGSSADTQQAEGVTELRRTR